MNCLISRLYIYISYIFCARLHPVPSATSLRSKIIVQGTDELVGVVASDPLGEFCPSTAAVLMAKIGSDFDRNLIGIQWGPS